METISKPIINYMYNQERILEAQNTDQQYLKLPEIDVNYRDQHQKDINGIPTMYKVGQAYILTRHKR